MAGRAEGEGWALVHSFGRAGKDCAKLEEGDIVGVAIEILGEHGQHSREERGTQHACLFAQRVANFDGGIGLRRKCNCVGYRTEGAVDGFVPAEREERSAEGRLLLGEGQCDDGAGERRQRVGEAVVAVDAGYFFDEVDLAFEIETPAGQGDGVSALAGFFQLAAERGKDRLGRLGGDAFGSFGLAEDALDFADLQG